MDLGQLFITGISGLTLTKDEKEILKKESIGGVIFFANNYEDPAQLTELTNEIKALNLDMPFFLAVDQEGGRVQRFKQGFTKIPSMFELARKLNSPKSIYDIHALMAKELSACGINLNFSPCADIWTNDKNKVIGDRSFGNTANSVEKFTSAAIRGLHSQNVLACAKHFPGHGMTIKDSHFDLPIVKSSIEELSQSEFIPFIKAAKSKVHFIMMAHLLVDSIDSEFPTSLSPAAYTLLREKLKYDDIIVSDDMEMKAVADRYGYQESAIRALEAGCDVLVYRSMETMLQGYEGIKSKEAASLLELEYFQKKIDRVTQVKKELVKTNNLIDITNITENLNQEEHAKILAKLLSE